MITTEIIIFLMKATNKLNVFNLNKLKIVYNDNI